METETNKTVKPDAIELWGQQRKTEIGGFYMIGHLDKNFHGCTAYVANYHDAQLIVKAWNSHYELLEALKKMTEQAEKLWSFADMPAEDKSGWAFKQAQEAIKKATN